MKRSPSGPSPQDRSHPHHPPTFSPPHPTPAPPSWAPMAPTLAPPHPVPPHILRARRRQLTSDDTPCVVVISNASPVKAYHCWMQRWLRITCDQVVSIIRTNSFKIVSSLSRLQSDLSFIPANFQVQHQLTYM